MDGKAENPGGQGRIEKSVRQKTIDRNIRISRKVKMKDERNENVFAGGAGGKVENDGKAAAETGEEAVTETSAEAGKKTAERTAAKVCREELPAAVPLLLGIVSMICIFVNSWVCIILAVGGIILGLFVRNHCFSLPARKLVLAGIICSAAGVVLGAFSMIFKLWVIGEMLTFFS